MNKFITYTAKAKLLNLIGKMESATALKLTYQKDGGIDISFDYSASHLNDIIISNVPKILTDTFTLKHLSDFAIDYSYASDDLMITRRDNVISANA